MSMSRTKLFLFNSLTTAFYQVIVMVSGFIVPKVMLQFYGSEINGLVSSISQFIAYFNLVEAGLSGAAIYALYKPLAGKDHKSINGVVSAAKKLYNQSGYIFLSLTLGMSFIYPLLVKTNAVTPFNVGLLIVILGVNGALEFFTLAKYRALLSADQKTYVLSIASAVQIIVNTAIIVVLANHKVDIVIIRFVALLSIFLRSIIMMIYVKVKYKYINYNVKPDLSALKKRWDVLYLQILGAIQVGSPILIVTFIFNLKLVSVYTIFNMVIAGIGGVLGIFISGLSASFGDVIARGEKKVLQKAYGEFEYLYYSLLAITYSVLFITIMPFIRIYTKGITDANYNLPVIGFLFVLNGLLWSIKTPQGMLVSSAGLFKETRVQTTIQGAIALLGGIILAPILGLAGVLIGPILSNIYRDIDLMCFIPRKVTGLPVKASAYRIIRLFICVAVICAPFLILRIEEATTYLSWSLNAAVACFYAVFVVALAGFIFERENLRESSKRILRMINK